MFKYLRLIFTAGIRILWDHIFYISKYARHPERYPLEERYKKIRSLIIYVVDKFRPDFKIKGLENLRRLEKENKTFLITSNHQSDMDPIMMIYFSEKPISFVSKMEAKKFPIIGKTVVALDGLFMDRNDLRQSLKVMMELEKRFEKGGVSYGIYPEGTRNKEMDKQILLPYKPGAVKAAKKAGVMILPVCMHGNFRLLPARPNYKRIPLEITFLDPLELDFINENDTETISEYLYSTTLKELEEQQKEDKDFFEKGYQKVPLRKGRLR